MKINAKITMLFGKDGLELSLEDDAAAVTFLKLHLSPEQTLQAMGRLACTGVENCEVFNLDRLGKTMKLDSFQFPIPTLVPNRKEYAKENADKFCPDGWIPDKSFDRQGSFVFKNGQEYAVCHCRKWE